MVIVIVMLQCRQERYGRINERRSNQLRGQTRNSSFLLDLMHEESESSLNRKGGTGRDPIAKE